MLLHALRDHHARQGVVADHHDRDVGGDQRPPHVLVALDLFLQRVPVPVQGLLVPVRAHRGGDDQAGVLLQETRQGDLVHGGAGLVDVAVLPVARRARERAPVADHRLQPPPVGAGHLGQRAAQLRRVGVTEEHHGGGGALLAEDAGVGGHGRGVDRPAAARALVDHRSVVAGHERVRDHRHPGRRREPLWQCVDPAHVLGVEPLPGQAGVPVHHEGPGAGRGGQRQDQERHGQPGGRHPPDPAGPVGRRRGGSTAAEGPLDEPGRQPGERDRHGDQTGALHRGGWALEQEDRDHDERPVPEVQRVGDVPEETGDAGAERPHRERRAVPGSRRLARGEHQDGAQHREAGDPAGERRRPW